MLCEADSFFYKHRSQLIFGGRFPTLVRDGPFYREHLNKITKVGTGRPAALSGQFNAHFGGFTTHHSGQRLGGTVRQHSGVSKIMKRLKICSDVM